MKKIILNLFLASLAISASAQNPPDNNNTNAPSGPFQPAPPPGEQNGTNAPDAGGPPFPPPEALFADATNNAVPDDRQVREPLVITPWQTKAAPAQEYQSNFLPPNRTGTNNPNELRLNFRNAPLEMVLNYMSDAAGFIIVLDAQVRGNVSVISSHPMTKDEAVDLLNSVLNKNGYAAIRNGRTLTIVDKNDAKTRDIPVKSGNKPEDISENAEIVTYIIPIRFVEARQLVSDLQSFVSPQATVVANEAGNSLVITDTQSNIRHLTEIIQAIDNSAQMETEIRVFKLKYASPTDVAAEISSVFPSSSSGNTAQAPTRFGGGGGGRSSFFAAMMGGGAGAGGGSSNDRVKKATQVTAVADARIQAVIVTAPKDLIEEIAQMMKDLDVPSDRDQNVYVFKMNNGDPQQVAQELQTMFQSNSSRNSGSSQNSALMQRQQTTTQTTSQNSSTTGFGTTGSSGGRGGIGGLP